MLAEIKKDLAVDFDLEKNLWGSYNRDKVIKVFEKYEFKTLITRLPAPDAAGYDGQDRLKEKNNLTLI